MLNSGGTAFASRGKGELCHAGLRVREAEAEVVFRGKSEASARPRVLVRARLLHPVVPPTEQPVSNVELSGLGSSVTAALREAHACRSALRRSAREGLTVVCVVSARPFFNLLSPGGAPTTVSVMVVVFGVVPSRTFPLFFSFRLHHRDFDLVPEGGTACRYM